MSGMYLLSSAELFSELAGAAGAEAGAAAGAAATGAATIGAAWYITGSDWLPLMEKLSMFYFLLEMYMI